MIDSSATSQPATQTNPARSLRVVAPSNDTDLEGGCRAVYVGGAGDVSLIAAGDVAAVTLTNVPAGAILGVCARRIMSTNTTATNIVALY